VPNADKSIPRRKLLNNCINNLARPKRLCRRGGQKLGRADIASSCKTRKKENRQIRLTQQGRYWLKNTRKTSRIGPHSEAKTRGCPSFGMEPSVSKGLGGGEGDDIKKREEVSMIRGAESEGGCESGPRSACSQTHWRGLWQGIMKWHFD